MERIRLRSYCFPWKAIASALTLVSSLNSSFAQTITISGYVTDANTGEALIGTNIYDVNLEVGTTTNNYGFFGLKLPTSRAVVRFSYQGYASQTITFRRSSQRLIEIKLKPIVLTLDSLEVTVPRLDRLEEQVQMSSLGVSMADVQTLPKLLGEPDILKTFQLMPGVQSGAEGSGGLYVRGSTPGQSLILLDGAAVYNAGHLFGFLSTFNSYAINNAILLKGGFPARYGGRLASVLDLTMREGNRKTFTGRGTVGLLASQLTIEGPIQRDKSSYIISARRTYLDLINLGIQKIFGSGFVQGYFFHDLNAKANFELSSRDRLFVSTYAGEDKGYEGDNNPLDAFRFEIGWRNITSTIRWSSVVNPQMYVNTMILYSQFRTQVLDRTNFADDSEDNGIGEGGTTVQRSRYASGIQDFGLKTDIEYQAHPNHSVRFGGMITRHLFRPSRQSHREFNEKLEIDNTSSINLRKIAVEWSAYGEDEFSITDKLKANTGIHVSGYHVDNVFYSSIQPRVSTSLILPSRYALKVSFAQMQQYIHQLSNSGLGLPTDLLLTSTPQIRPQRAWQVALGVARTIDSPSLDISLEAYYKDMQGLIAYKEGSNFVGSSTNWESTITSGRGWAYGAELFVHRKRGAITGWLGYTLSWSKRRISDLNRGDVYPHRYDRRHDISVVLSYKWNSTKLSATWVYSTGRAETLTSSQYLDRGVLINVYAQRNNFRLPAYHKLDLAVHFPSRKRKKSELSVSLYNAYNRHNALYLKVRDSSYLDTRTGSH
ncbi:MAG: TonB-dependent receptor, partial [Bacteroidota bacterium]|nr:TonB-dependent receptor [Bacteroidota bacterium]